MNNNKNGLDEMQTQRRDSIGNQMFMLMFWSLLLNGILHFAGITWFPYPVNVMVITAACMGIYLIRLIASNAYLPGKAQNRKTIVSLIMAIVLSVGFGMLAILVVRQSSVGIVENTSDNSAIILLTISVVSLICAFIIAAIKKARNKDGDDE